MNEEIKPVEPLFSLRDFTDARIAIGRTGTSIPVKEMLKFNLAHADARDAVYSVLDTEMLRKELKEFNLPVLNLHSKATSRDNYLKRPDLGRQLNEESSAQISAYADQFDIAIIIADGLSATAVNENAFKLLHLLIPLLTADKSKLTPIAVVEQGRVAIGDDIGYCLNARLALVLIGERPGLSAADSMGVYLTYDPKPGLTDEMRNCVSNIRKQGLKHKAAAHKIHYLISEAFNRKLSGVALKDNAGLPSH